MVNVKNNIEILKYQTGFTSEAIFDIPEQLGNQCPTVDGVIRTINDVVKYLDRVQYKGDLDEYQSVIDDAIYDVSNLEDDLETLRESIIEIRAWGEEWKQLAKSLSNELQLSKLEEYLNFEISEESYEMKGLELVNDKFG